MNKATLSRLHYRRGWDTRCRNLVPARMLRQAIDELPLDERGAVLDVGCGRAGVAAFLTHIPVVGVDVDPPDEPPSNLTYVPGTITNLPFRDRAFPLVSCIDVLENLPDDMRTEAIGELIRVARKAVLIACPQGEVAERCDREFERKLQARRRPVPEWIGQHQAHAYPTVHDVIERIREADQKAKIAVSFSEPTSVSRIVRGAAARSNALYAATNLLFGSLVSVIRTPDAKTGYRMIVYAELA